MRELFFDSDAFGFWGNKEWEFNNRLQKTGLEGMRNVLIELATRAEQGLAPKDLRAIWEMRGLGTLLSTEFLAYRYPDRYWTYSANVTLSALQKLGDNVRDQMPRGQKSDAHLYFALESRLAEIRTALRNAGVPNVDNLVADIFLWWVNKKDTPLPSIEKKVADSEDQVTTNLPVSPHQIWLFQANPKYFDLLTELSKAQPGETWDWTVTAHRDEMQAGDIVVLWQSGRQGGICGIAELINQPYERTTTPNEAELQQKPYRRADWWVDLRILRDLNPPISRAEVKADPVLQNLGVLKFSQGTNYPVLPEEWQIIRQRIQKRGASVDTDSTKQIVGTQKVLDLDSTSPSYNAGASSKPAVSAGFELANTLDKHIASQALYFTPWQIATYYTALQTKGFVILSGISGTGKTKLAQAFADALPQPAQREVALADDVITVTVQPYMRKYGRLIIPKQAVRLFDPPPPGEAQEVKLKFDNTSQTCRFVHASYGNSDYLSLLLRGKARQWFVNTFAEEDTIVLQPELSTEDKLTGFQIGTLETLAAQTPAQRAGDGQRNVLFVPVRTDWRDSKSLLGYYNPLTGTYEWTPFLRFLMRAVHSHRVKDGFAWFVILDEMNLARVEYYFADLLSVLESGRDAGGWTRESLRLGYPDTAEGDLPPKELRLPPNIYIVGTVNVDETTHVFSPKVLDRAFTLELTEADFSQYPALTPAQPNALTAAQQHALLLAFTNHGVFVRIDKAEIAAYVAAHPHVRQQLDTLNTLLRPYDMHFGYRVFDEIVAFLHNAARNGLYDALSGDAAAFDTAVLMKVLPKFHGSRGKLEQPLKQVLAWCLDPESPAEEILADTFTNLENSDDIAQTLANLNYRYPHTAARVRRMLWALYTSGFAAFG
ncbi:MAG: EVE domain-containing protein [Anaerolineae bacterium]|nr:EVE domain-containing protein [Anaerolineae bacterium]